MPEFILGAMTQNERYMCLTHHSSAGVLVLTRMNRETMKPQVPATPLTSHKPFSNQSSFATQHSTALNVVLTQRLSALQRIKMVFFQH